MQFIQNIKKDKYVLLSFLIFSFISLFFGTKSSLFYSFNDWVDPNAYFTMAKGWVNGYIPYKDLFDHKGPLLYVIFGIGYIISNDSFFGMYILQSISLTIVLYFIYKLAHLFICREYAYLVSFLFSIVYFRTNMQGASCEEFILLFQTIGLYLFFKHFIDKDNPRNLYNLFIQGLLIGSILLIKFNLIIFWFFPLSAIIIQCIIDRNYKLSIQYIATTILGILTIILPFAIYFYRVNGLSDLWESYIVFNTLYGSGFSSEIFMGILTMLLKKHTLIALFMVIGVLYFTFSKSKINNILFRISILLMFISTYFSIFKSKYYIYYPIAIIIITVLGFIAIFCIVERIRIWKKEKYKYLLIITSLLIIISINIFLKLKMIQGRNNAYFQIEFTDYMKANSQGEDITILNTSMDDGYFLLTNTIPPNKYYYRPNIPDEVYPNIMENYINTIKSTSAPLYLTVFKSISIKRKLNDPDSFYTLIESKYDIVKVHTIYDEWPATQYTLYKRKK